MQQVLVVGKGKLQKGVLIHLLAEHGLEFHKARYLPQSSLFLFNGKPFEVALQSLDFKRYQHLPGHVCIVKSTPDVELMNWISEHIAKSPLLPGFNVDWTGGQESTVIPVKQWVLKHVFNPNTATAIRNTQLPTRHLKVLKKLAAMKKETSVETPMNFPHPFIPNAQVTGVKVLKVYNSNAKPIKIEMTTPETKKHAVFKVSDDLNMDLFCMNLVVDIWARHKIEYRWEKEMTVYSEPVVNVLYNIAPTSISSGFIEFVDGIPMAKIFSKNTILDLNVTLHGNQLSNNNLHQHGITPARSSFCRMMATGVAIYVLGIKDRHQDNMMRAADGSVLHIDLQKVFGERVLVESSKFPLPFFFWEWLTDQGQVAEFFQLCFLAFTTLVLYKAEIKTAVETLAQTMAHSTRAHLRLDKTLKENMLFEDFMVQVQSGTINKIVKDTIHHVGI